MFASKLLCRMLIVISLIALLSGCAGFQTGRRELVTLDDSVVTANVKDALAKDPILGKYKIDVNTVSGEVILRGRVGSLQDVYHAAEVVNNVRGVHSLFNDLSEK